MSDTKVNYTPEMEKILRDAVPFNHERAIELGIQLGKKPASIVAKINRMANEADKAGEWYIVKAPYVAKTGDKPITKGEIVANIAGALGVEKLDNLVKADKATLVRLFEAVAEEVETDES